VGTVIQREKAWFDYSTASEEFKKSFAFGSLKQFEAKFRFRYQSFVMFPSGAVNKDKPSKL
jgi:hypothetical protein